MLRGEITCRITLLGLVLVVAALPTVETAVKNFKWAVLAVGDDDSVVFRVVVGDDVTVGEDVIIQGPVSETEDSNQLTLTIPDGALIPNGVGVTDMAIIQGVLSNTPQRMPVSGIVEMKTLEEMHYH